MALPPISNHSKGADPVNVERGGVGDTEDPRPLPGLAPPVCPTAMKLAMDTTKLNSVYKIILLVCFLDILGPLVLAVSKRAI